MMHDDVYGMYLEELEALAMLTVEEAQKLADLARAGDIAARKSLIEGELRRIVEIAREYEGRGLMPGDLIQEANMALAVAAAEFLEGSWAEFSGRQIRAALEEAVGAQDAEEKALEAVLARVNVLKDISQSMAEELGREATVEELAERMRMTQEEIRDIMKVTLDALSVSSEG